VQQLKEREKRIYVGAAVETNGKKKNVTHSGPRTDGAAFVTSIKNLLRRAAVVTPSNTEKKRNQFSPAVVPLNFQFFTGCSSCAIKFGIFHRE